MKKEFKVSFTYKVHGDCSVRGVTEDDVEGNLERMVLDQWGHDVEDVKIELVKEDLS